MPQLGLLPVVVVGGGSAADGRGTATGGCGAAVDGGGGVVTVRGRRSRRRRLPTRRLMATAAWRRCEGDAVDGNGSRCGPSRGGLSSVLRERVRLGEAPLAWRDPQILEKDIAQHCIIM
jgi:hypothetical protein